MLECLKGVEAGEYKVKGVIIRVSRSVVFFFVLKDEVRLTN